jgi:hypothetical protein
MLLPAVSIIALCGIAASSAAATEAPFYKLNSVGRLKAKETREVGLKAEGSQVLKSTGAGITITCTGIATKAGATIIGSEAPEPGTSSGVIEYSGCTIVGNGEKCVVTSVKGAKDKKIVTKALKDELVYGAEKPGKGTKIQDLFKAVEGPFVVVKFEAEAGGTCKFTETSVEGSVDVEILNAKKETVAFEEHEVEEKFGYIRALPNATKECKFKGGALDKCVTSSLKAFGVASTLEGTSEAFLTGTHAGQVFGVFSKGGGGGGWDFSLSAGATKIKTGASTKVTVINVSGATIEPTEMFVSTTGDFGSNQLDCLGKTYDPIPATSAKCEFTTTYHDTGTHTEEFTIYLGFFPDSNTLTITGEP